MRMSGNKEPENQSTSVDPVIAFVLFNSKHINWDAFKRNMEKDWDIKIAENPKENGPLVFEADGMLVACGFVDVPVPDGEAEENAKTNLMWKDAVKVTSTHQAHVLIYVLNATDAIKRSLLHTKVTCSFLKMENAIGVYQNSTVLSPEFYIEGASSITKGYLLNFPTHKVGLNLDKLIQICYKIYKSSVYCGIIEITTNPLIPTERRNFYGFYYNRYFKR